MNKCLCIVLLCFSISAQKISAQLKTENLVIITLDGMRREEVFGGADFALLKNKNFTRDSAGASSKFWNDNVEKRREIYFLLYGALLQARASYTATGGMEMR